MFSIYTLLTQLSNESKTILLFMFDIKAIWLTLFDHILILSETDTIISLVPFNYFVKTVSLIK